MCGSLQDKFWARVERRSPDECWLWVGSLTPQGYGVLSHGGRKWAHRVSVLLSGRDIPADMVVDHICRVRNCVNPDHLRVVTKRINGIENSTSPAALNAMKSHCAKGHEFTPDNIRMRKKRGGLERVCVACHREDVKASRRRKREEARALGVPSAEKLSLARYWAKKQQRIILNRSAS